MISVNFIPREVCLAQAQRRRLWRWGTLSLAGLLLLGAAAGFDYTRRARADELRGSSEGLRMEIDLVRANLRGVTTELIGARNHLDHATALRTKRAWSGMIALIDNSMPENCWLTSISTDPEAPQALKRGTHRTSKKSDGKNEPEVVVIDAPRRLEIIGYAAKPSEPNEFVNQLNKTGVFSHVELKRSQREPMLDGTYYRFELFCEW